MIHDHHGDLLTADVEALVNPVNTVGVMGKGLALQFRQHYPAMFAAYRQAARHGDLVLGQMHVWPTGIERPRLIVNFPTKGHWRDRSRLADVEAGLVDLARVVVNLQVGSLAIPPLGCGLGGLDWALVRPLIEAAFAELPEVEVWIYPP